MNKGKERAREKAVPAVQAAFLVEEETAGGVGDQPSLLQEYATSRNGDIRYGSTSGTHPTARSHRQTPPTSTSTQRLAPAGVSTAVNPITVAGPSVGSNSFISTSSVKFGEKGAKLKRIEEKKEQQRLKRLAAEAAAGSGNAAGSSTAATNATPRSAPTTTVLPSAQHAATSRNAPQNPTTTTLNPTPAVWTPVSTSVPDPSLSTQATAEEGDDDTPLPVDKAAADLEKEHNRMLATNWYRPADLKVLADQGYKIKDGMFTRTEQKQVDKALEKYRFSRGLNEESLHAIVFAKGRGDRPANEGFWKEIAQAVPGRPLRSVHSHVKRKLDPNARKGPWHWREDEELKRSYAQHGPNWVQIGKDLERNGDDCRDRYRHFVAHSDARATGAWSLGEEERLRTAVVEVANTQGISIEQTNEGLLWETVAAKLGHKRSGKQCRSKWVDTMLPEIVAKRKKTPFSREDCIMLCKRLQEQKAKDITEVDWNALGTSTWMSKDGRKLHKMFNKLSAKVPGGESMSFRRLVTATLLVAEARLENKKKADERREAKMKSFEYVNERRYDFDSDEIDADL